MPRDAITITGKNFNLGTAFQEAARDEIAAVIEKYFGDAVQSQVYVAKHPHHTERFDITISTHVKKGLQVEASGFSSDIYDALKESCSHLGKKLRRYKRYVAGSQRHKEQVFVGEHKSFVLQDNYDLDQETADIVSHSVEEEPLIIAEMSSNLESLTLGEAIHRLRLQQDPIFLFQSEKTGKRQIVFERPDGHVGWIQD